MMLNAVTLQMGQEIPIQQAPSGPSHHHPLFQVGIAEQMVGV